MKPEGIKGMGFFAIAIPVATAVLGYIAGFLREKWKAKEDRRKEIERLRRPIYAEALKVLCDLEQCQYQSDKLGPAIARLQEWIYGKATDMPPQMNALLDGVNYSARRLLGASLGNDADKSIEAKRGFDEDLGKAKTFLINNEAIRWLPEDRRLS